MTSRWRPARHCIRRSPGWGLALGGAVRDDLLEDAGRLQMRVGMLVPPDDPERTLGVAPLAVRSSFRAGRAATMRPNELADTVLAAFRRSVEALARS